MFLCYNIKLWTKENVQDKTKGIDSLYLNSFGLTIHGLVSSARRARLRLGEIHSPPPSHYSRQLASTGNLTNNYGQSWNNKFLFKLNPSWFKL